MEDEYQESEYEEENIQNYTNKKNSHDVNNAIILENWRLEIVEMIKQNKVDRNNQLTNQQKNVKQQIAKISSNFSEIKNRMNQLESNFFNKLETIWKIQCASIGIISLLLTLLFALQGR